MAKTVNKKDLNLAILKSGIIEKRARQIANDKLNGEKFNLIQNFANHPVSTEIAAGPNAGNSSGTLGGYGNLFSFIGFSAGQDPVKDWINLLQNKIKILKSKGSINQNNLVYSFKVNGISTADLSAAKMPWESGKSWILAIERGISGFSFYISKALGRSGGGIQSNHPVRGKNYSPVNYWTSMWENFVKKLNN